MMLAPQPIASVQTTTDLLVALCQRFPKSADQIMAWAPSFKRVLGHLQPDRLDAVWSAVIDRWEKGFPPMPADFAKAIGDAAPAPSSGGYGAELFRGRPWLEYNRLSKEAETHEKALLQRSHAANHENIEGAASKWGVAAVDLKYWADRFVFRATPRGKDYESHERARVIAYRHVFEGDALPEFLELSQADWANAKRYAEAKRDHPERFTVEAMGGNRSRSRAHPEKEARRQQQLDNAKQN